MWRPMPPVKEHVNSDEENQEIGSADEPSTVYFLSHTSVFQK
jgi:hypothetical protein